MTLHILAWLRGILCGPGSRRLEDFGVKELRTKEEFEQVLSESEQQPVFLFKHSTTCPISSSAYRRVTEYLEDHGGTRAPVYLIKVIESRPVSNEIADRLNVVHQSPQIILVKQGAAAWNTSHGAIDATGMERALAAAESQT